MQLTVDDYRRALLQIETALIELEAWIARGTKEGADVVATSDRLGALLGHEFRLHVASGVTLIHATLTAIVGKLDAFPLPRAPAYRALRLLLEQLCDLSGSASRSGGVTSMRAQGATKCLARTLHCAADVDLVSARAFCLVENVLTDLYELLQSTEVAK